MKSANGPKPPIGRSGAYIPTVLSSVAFWMLASLPRARIARNCNATDVPQTSTGVLKLWQKPEKYGTKFLLDIYC